MIEIYITNIENEVQANVVLKSILKLHPDLIINFDLNETNIPFPCGHTILKVEGHILNPERILQLVNDLGYLCEILEDKICK